MAAEMASVPTAGREGNEEELFCILTAIAASGSYRYGTLRGKESGCYGCCRRGTLKDSLKKLY